MTGPWRLDGGGQTVVIAIQDGRPHLAYWGPELPTGGEARLETGLRQRAVAHGMLDGGEAFDLLPEAACGFTGHPALETHRSSGAFVCALAATAVRHDGDGLVVALVDPEFGLAAEQLIRMDAATGVLSFQLRLVNTADEPLALDWVSPAALEAPGEALLTFGGRWAREMQAARLALSSGLWSSESRTGRTSHHAPPFLVAGTPGFGDDHGIVLGVHLAWSGDHRLFVERIRDGRLQVQAGERFWPGELTLAAGEAYETPLLYAARSEIGLNGLSDRLHPFVRRRIVGGRLEGRPRPVHFNTWEAVYFRHELAELQGLAETAAAVGVERFVLDDGWFRGRENDSRGLGDWAPDPRKFPLGLEPLISHVRGLGMQFGLWVEPEMANPDSELLRAHPDWTLGVLGRTQPLGRGQLVLDLTRAEVADHVFSQLDVLLRENAIDYLKWDMNRDLTHPASRGRAAARRQVLAVYGLMDRLRAAHPHVEIESCASGGGRADYAVLAGTERIWTSDCNDPLERQSIQDGFSIFFPPEVMGAHVGPEASHTTARTASLEMRSLTAIFGHFGIEADLRDLSAAERTQLAGAVALYKQMRPLLHAGRHVRLSPPDPGARAFLVTNGTEALVSVAQLSTPATAVLPPLKLAGLDGDARYGVRLLNPAARWRAAMKFRPALAAGERLSATGLELAVLGLPMPILRAGEIALFHLEREPG